MKTVRSAQSWLRLVLALAAAAGLLLVGGCDEGGEIGGVGASTTLPSIFTNTGAEAVDTGVGSIHWVGNPRW
ncbi:MAG: hypothetical protein KA151_05580 [Piscinibacter sp.]|nr:hypothetical protein [Piscinibacter sp.]